MAKSELEALFLREWQLRHVPQPKPQYQFAYPVRRWKCDFAWPDHMLIVEIEGGTWSGGRHTSGAGYSKDCEKYNNATACGWKVLRFTSDMLTSDKLQDTLDLVETVLLNREFKVKPLPKAKGKKNVRNQRYTRPRASGPNASS